jgi:hypothetical protein
MQSTQKVYVYGVTDYYELKERIAKRFGWRCWYCGIKLPEGEGQIDHIVPKCAGGSDERRNLALTCPQCNRAKWNRPLEEFMHWLEWIRTGGSFTPYNMSSKREVYDAEYQSKAGNEDLPELPAEIPTEAEVAEVLQ